MLPAPWIFIVLAIWNSSMWMFISTQTIRYIPFSLSAGKDVGCRSFQYKSPSDWNNGPHFLPFSAASHLKTNLFMLLILMQFVFILFLDEPRTNCSNCSLCWCNGFIILIIIHTNYTCITVEGGRGRVSCLYLCVFVM